MHTPDPVDAAAISSASDIPLERYITKILADYGVTNSRLNEDQNQKIEVNAANTREQLQLHIVASASEATILRDLYDAKITNVSEKLNAYVASHKEVHSVLKSELKKAQDAIKALGLAIQAHLREHELRDRALSELKGNSKE
jgi:hypothetical protein